MKHTPFCPKDVGLFNMGEDISSNGWNSVGGFLFWLTLFDMKLWEPLINKQLVKFVNRI